MFNKLNTLADLGTFSASVINIWASSILDGRSHQNGGFIKMPHQAVLKIWKQEVF